MRIRIEAAIRVQVETGSAARTTGARDDDPGPPLHPPHAARGEENPRKEDAPRRLRVMVS